PSQTMHEDVATKEKGVVMISPFNARALMAICNPIVPLDTYNKNFVPRYSFNFSSSSFDNIPIFVIHPRFHIPGKYFSYSSRGGKKGFVIGIIEIGTVWEGKI